MELEEIGDVEVEEKLAGKTGRGHEAAMGDERNAKVYEGGEEVKLASKTGTGGEEEGGREEGTPRCMMGERRSSKEEAK